jgi:hypothetical protein
VSAPRRIGPVPPQRMRLFEWLRPVRCHSVRDEAGDITYWYRREWRWAR